MPKGPSLFRAESRRGCALWAPEGKIKSLPRRSKNFICPSGPLWGTRTEGGAKQGLPRRLVSRFAGKHQSRGPLWAYIERKHRTAKALWLLCQYITPEGPEGVSAYCTFRCWKAGGVSAISCPKGARRGSLRSPLGRVCPFGAPWVYIGPLRAYIAPSFQPSVSSIGFANR